MTDIALTTDRHGSGLKDSGPGSAAVIGCCCCCCCSEDVDTPVAMATEERLSAEKIRTRYMLMSEDDAFGRSAHTHTQALLADRQTNKQTDRQTNRQTERNVAVIAYAHIQAATGRDTPDNRIIYSVIDR